MQNCCSPSGRRLVRLAVAALFVAATVTAGCRPPEEAINAPRLHISELVAPCDLETYDTPGDKGGSITIRWRASPTENTPDFLIRREIKRQQQQPGLSIEEKQRIQKEVEALYRTEPPMEYRIHTPADYDGLMKLLAAMYAENPDQAEGAWKAVLKQWKTASGSNRLKGLFALARLGIDFRDAEPPAFWQSGLQTEKKASSFAQKTELAESLFNELLFNEAISMEDDITRAFLSCALSRLPITRAKGDLAGIEQFLKKLASGDEPIRHREYALEKACAQIGSAQLHSRMKAILARLLDEDRNRLSDAEQAELEQQRDLIKERLPTLEKSLAETDAAPIEALKNADWPQRLAHMEKNVTWEKRMSFRSGVNFKKAATGPCEFEESGEDVHYVYLRGLENGIPYRFKVELVLDDQVLPVKTMDDNEITTAECRPNWFDPRKAKLLITVVGLSLVVLVFIRRARKNPDMFIRRIAGLNAVDDALQKAKQHDRPVYYIMGLGLMSDLPTIASVSILERVSRMAAKNGLRLKVPCYDSVVMSVAQDVVTSAYEAEGRSPKQAREDVFFVTSDQFSYAASVDGLLLRDRPSTNFFMGNFQAESLLLSEVGSSVGAVQIAGTDQPSQLPFFVTTTDYTLIGEELYAASAYLSRNPLLLGSLRGQDVGKILLVATIIVGTVLTTLGVDAVWRFFT